MSILSQYAPKILRQKNAVNHAIVSCRKTFVKIKTSVFHSKKIKPVVLVLVMWSARLKLIWQVFSLLGT